MPSVPGLLTLADFRQPDAFYFSRLWLRLRRLKGWLNATDARLLYSLAGCLPGEGAVVEIGSAWGKSTIVLAAAARRYGREKVVAIDPHTGDPWYMQQAGITTANTFSEFRSNLEAFAVDDWVTPVVATSAEAAHEVLPLPIRLLYIDGLHTYEAVKADIATWTPHVVAGGAVVFDDYFNPARDVGVKRAVDEMVASGTLGGDLLTARNFVWVIRESGGGDGG